MTQTQSDIQRPRHHQLFFAGDSVQLAGQIDYPEQTPPEGGYPLLFIIQHATCTSRDGYAHIARLGNEHGWAVFRWDKRGTGKSGASSQGDSTQDSLHAYKTALKQDDVNPEHAVIIAQNEGSLILGEQYEQFQATQVPLGVLLLGNMLDETQITAIACPTHIVMSKNDWNAWQTYGESASEKHAKYHKYDTDFYVAPNTNRRLMYINGGTFHRGAYTNIVEWLGKICPTSK
jgi:hypothetical protein